MCHPECRWACDDPVCNAECTIVTEPPVCICENNPSIVPICRIECPPDPDQCESDQCPSCVTICTPNQECNQNQILCEAPVAKWACRKPSSCRNPICELVCERPACEYDGLSDPWKKNDDLNWPILIAVILLVLYFTLSLQK